MARKITKLPQAETTPIDVAISRHLQNIIATYGETKVRNSLNYLFDLKIPKNSKKAG
jgi:hypothetical protein